jgi:aspartate-semialdehyde dehydrogenase
VCRGGGAGAPDARLGAGKAITPKLFDHQIAFNVIPHIDKFGEGATRVRR